MSLVLLYVRWSLHVHQRLPKEQSARKKDQRCDKQITPKTAKSRTKLIEDLAKWRLNYDEWTERRTYGPAIATASTSIGLGTFLDAKHRHST